MGRVLLNIVHILKLNSPTECRGQAYRAVWNISVESIYWSEGTGVFNGYRPIENWLCDYVTDMVLPISEGNYDMAAIQGFFTVLLGKFQEEPDQVAVRKGKTPLDSSYHIENALSH
jgi:hypothetical protein